MDQKRRLQVFVSSTFEDLKEERKAAVEGILEAGHIPAGMELFTAGDQSQWKLIQDWIENSDVYMLLAGARYGSIKPKSKKSYTQLEYEFAKKLKKHSFSLLGNHDYIQRAISTNAVDEHSDDYKKATEFRRKISSNAIVDHFGNRDEVKSCTILALNKFAAYPDVAGWIRGTVQNGPKLLFPKTWEVGHGLLVDVEDAHNVSAVRKMLLDESGRTMKIGSPYLRYWLSSEDCKLSWLIEHTQEIVIELVLAQAINPSENYASNRRELEERAHELARSFPDRLKFKSVDRPTDLSYITYPLKEGGGVQYRAMVGIQTSKYLDRPFLEFVYSILSPPPLVMAAERMHVEEFEVG